jgi:hypothetical protein
VPRRESWSAPLVGSGDSLAKQLFCIHMAKEPPTTHDGSLLLVVDAATLTLTSWVLAMPGKASAPIRWPLRPLLAGGTLA